VSELGLFSSASCRADLVSVTAYAYFAATYFPTWPTPGSCAGTEGAAIFGCALLTSYLFLFIAFYKKTYNAQVAAGKKKAIAAQKATKAVVGPPSKLD